MNHPLTYSVNWDALDDELDSLHPSHGSIFADEHGDCWRDIYHPADFNEYNRAENRFRLPSLELTTEEALKALHYLKTYVPITGPIRIPREVW